MSLMSNHLGTVCIGDPFTPCLSPREWVKNHRGTKSLILTAPPTANPLAFSHDLTVVTTLRELHVKNPVYLSLKLAGAKSPLHWLHDIAINNRSLEKLTLYGPGSTGLEPQQIARFKISNYFEFGSQALPSLQTTALTLRHFILSDTELGQLLKFCPKLTHLELEYVVFVSDTSRMALYKGLRELVLVQTKPTARLNHVLSSVHTLVLKCDVDPPTKLTKNNFWKLSIGDFDTMVLGMPLLTTVKVDRVAFVEQYPEHASAMPHDNILQVFKNVHSDLSAHFPRAVILPYKN